MSFITRNKLLTDNKNSEKGYGIKCANKNNLSPYFQTIYEHQQNFYQENKKRRCLIDRKRGIILQRNVKIVYIFIIFKNLF